MLRAMDEFRIAGIATTIPAAQAILSHPDFVEAKHSTNWVETVLDLSEVGIAPVSTDSSDDEPAKVKRDVDVEVNGRRYAVSMWVPDVPMATGGGAVAAAPRPRRSSSGGSGGAAGAGKITSPMQGTVFKLPVHVGDEVAEGQTICVLEAMKMENNIAADKAGTVVELKVEEGQSVSAGDLIAVIE
jgi:acetyl-CoA/propionyl-CoA carboxylase biotin carboxyl carrier protein